MEEPGADYFHDSYGHSTAWKSCGEFTATAKRWQVGSMKAWVLTGFQALIAKMHRPAGRRAGVIEGQDKSQLVE
jgi:hypothetical protein